MSRSISVGIHESATENGLPDSGVWCIVVAGGAGTRYGGLKQFDRLAGHRIIDWSVRTAEQTCGGVVVVLPKVYVGTDAASFGPETIVVAGGATRAESVRAGLAAIPDSVGYVLVHDGARPLATPELFDRVISVLRGGAEVVVPGVPVADTLRSVEGGTVDRESLRAVQTPQGFSADVLREAHVGGGEATDDAGLAERAGRRVEIVEGERLNFKITEPLDLELAEAVINSGATAIRTSDLG